MRTIMMAAGALVLAACGGSGMAVGTPAAGGAQATAMLRTADGKDAGRATATEVNGGLRVTVDAKGVPAGISGGSLS